MRRCQASERLTVQDVESLPSKDYLRAFPRKIERLVQPDVQVIVGRIAELVPFTVLSRIGEAIALVGIGHVTEKIRIARTCR